MLSLLRVLWPLQQHNSGGVTAPASAQTNTGNTALPFAERTGQELFMLHLLPYPWVHTKKIQAQLQLQRGSCYRQKQTNKNHVDTENWQEFSVIFAFQKVSHGTEKGFSLRAGSVFLRSHFVLYLYLKCEILQEPIKPSSTAEAHESLPLTILKCSLWVTEQGKRWGQHTCCSFTGKKSHRRGQVHGWRCGYRTTHACSHPSPKLQLLSRADSWHAHWLSPMIPTSQGLVAPSLVDHKGDAALSHGLTGRVAQHGFWSGVLCAVMCYTTPISRWNLDRIGYPYGSSKGSWTGFGTIG